MVTLQILVLSFQVRILVAQLKNRSDLLRFFYFIFTNKGCPEEQPYFIGKLYKRCIFKAHDARETAVYSA